MRQISSASTSLVENSNWIFPWALVGSMEQTTRTSSTGGALTSLPPLVDSGKGVEEITLTWNKDSFITQDRNEHFEGGTHEATFSRGHSSLTWGTIFKNWVPNERYGYYLSTDTLWVVAGQMVWSQQPCNVSHFSENFKIAEKLAFFMTTETLIFAHFFFKMLSLRDEARYWLQTNFIWSQIS